MRAFALLFVLLAAGGPAAADPLAALRQGESASVIEVVDGDTVVLNRAINGAMQVRLVGLQAPKLPLGRKNFPVWPLAEASKNALESLVLDRKVTLYFGGNEMDRHGRLLAHLFLDGGRWVQCGMLRMGMARVYTFADNRAVAEDMYEIERAARSAHRGIWGLRFYALRTPDQTAGHIGTFQIVEGRVLAAAKVKGRVYLNFGEDWRTDFTVTLPAATLRMFGDLGRDPLALEGRRIRVRGWLKKRNGSMIQASHPEQIEVIEPKHAAVLPNATAGFIIKRP